MKIHIAHIVSLSILLSISSTTSHAETFRFRNYKVQDGLPSNTVRCLTQDSYGFMWFGAENGLSRFDGHSFKNFVAMPCDSTSLGNNYIYALYEDSGQGLWVGTDEGVYTYSFSTEQFTFFSKRTDSGMMIRSHITNMKGNTENIWISTHTQGLFRYDRRADRLYNYSFGTDNPNTSGSNVVFTLYIDRNNVVWATSQGSRGGLYRYDSITDKFADLPLRLERGDHLNDQIHALIEDSEHNFWLGTWRHGLCKLDINTGMIQSFLHPGAPNGILHIHEITEYKPGTLLVGSNDGLSVFNTHTCASELMTASEFKSSTLSDKFVYPIYKDNEGGLWVGTYYGGVNYAPPPKGEIAGYSFSNYVNSVGGNIISCFCEDACGNIWIGSDDGGLSCFDPQKKTFKNYMPDKNRNSLSHYNVHALCFDRDKLWIGVYSGGLNVLDLKTNRFKYYYSADNDSASLYDNSIYSIYKDHDDIWIGSMEGICLYNSKKNNFIRMKNTGITTVDIIGDADNNVWFATWGGGLFRHNKESKKWRHYLHNPNNTASIPHNQINSLHIDADGRFWLGTNNGLALYNKETDTFSVIPLAIHNNQISYVRNINGILWMATNNGLVSYTLKDHTIRSFFQNDGLQSDQFNMKAGCLSTSGYLYLGTVKGFNVINPRDLSENDYIPPIHITNLQISNKDLKTSDMGGGGKSILYTTQIELSYKENAFSIEYAALSYNTPSKNLYKYKLEGFDKEWNMVGNQRKAIYMNLPPGKYVFRVKGSNNDGVWNNQGAELTIIVHPPFWLTPLAYALYALLILGTLAYIIYMISRREKKKHEKSIQQLHQEKEKELYDAKINFFTLIAHEIRTPVSLIIGPLEKIMEDIHTLPAQAQDSLYIIDRNGQRLLSLVNQLLDFRKAEEKSFIINFSPYNIYDLLQSIWIRFEPMATQQNITLLLEAEDKDATAIVDAEAFIKMISNLLTNALKFTKDLIKITVTAGDEQIYIKVTDNGEGIPEINRQHIFLPFYQVTQNYKSGTGIGLSLVKLLVDAHHGKIEVDSMPYQGTTFTVILPKTQPDYPSPSSSSDSNEETGYASQKESYYEELQKTLAANLADKPVLLIVEDSHDMCKFLCKSLCSEYQIIEAKNGKEGLLQLYKQSVDIIISDIMMPVMDGITFTREVKENLQFSHIPLVLLSAKTDNTSKIEGIKAGADAYIEKPFSPQILTAQIQNLVESRKKLRKKFSEMPFASLSSVAGNKADQQFLDKINKIIDRNIANQDFSIDKLAEEVCISRSGLFAKVKLLADMTPNELIQLIRLKKAAQLLSTREYRINEICYLVGFNNPSYFSKCFQNQFGILPKEFINHVQNK
jgi:signal transduction histidine kinase/ligand-binding sensor domain-containing protein/DNA-binding response OmpR family regulator